MPGPMQALLDRPLTRRRLGAGLAGLAAAGTLPAFSVSAAPPTVPTRGFNLPGWVDRQDGVAPAKPVLEKLRQAGFESVRLPVAADPLLADMVGRAVMLGRIGSAISQLAALGFSVIVDLHPDGEFHTALQSDPPEGSRQAVEVWKALAPILADMSPDHVYAELLNEPPLEPATWLALRDELAGTVRAKCPRHTIVWGTAPYQGIWELDGVAPLADDNSIVAVHYYTPMGFTHQCQSWGDSPLGRIGKLPFPATRETPQVRAVLERLQSSGDAEAAALVKGEFDSPWTVRRIEKDFADLGAWSARNHCPAMVNEFGVLDFCVDPSSRGNWVRAVRQAAEANNVGWTYWELDQGFGFIEDRTRTDGFDHAMIDAMMGA